MPTHDHFTNIIRLTNDHASLDKQMTIIYIKNNDSRLTFDRYTNISLSFHDRLATTIRLTNNIHLESTQQLLHDQLTTIVRLSADDFTIVS